MFLTGKKGKERVYRINRLDIGDVLHKRGSANKEFIWKREILSTNVTVFYEGGRNAEAIRRIVRGSKTNPAERVTTFFGGPRGEERARPYLCTGDENRVAQIYAAPMA